MLLLIIVVAIRTNFFRNLADISLYKFDSVINKDLTVHDINNLYISGSSSFVTSGYTNPTFTIVQLAIRLAKKINERLNG